MVGNKFNIPKKIHMYWGRNKNLSFMRYMTPYSFSKLNPDWEIHIYYPVRSCKTQSWGSFEQKAYDGMGRDYFADLRLIHNVFLHEVDFDIFFENSDNVSEVMKSDFYRYYLLNTIGGCWSDFDILYLNPFKVLEYEADTYFSFFKGYFSIGLLFSTKGNLFYKIMEENAKRLCNTKNIDGYQEVGTHLLAKVIQWLGGFDRMQIGLNCRIGLIQENVVYPFAWNEIENIFGNDNRDLNDSLGIHWYAGSDISSVYDNSVTKENIGEYKDKFLLRLMGDMV